ncbi:hypothetical protein ASF47_01480 [Nocardioides sp. Leaf285]|nr:hypothetical protein ASF47_01480 [Nocardioides sp. Leaf285]
MPAVPLAALALAAALLTPGVTPLAGSDAQAAPTAAATVATTAQEASRTPAAQTPDRRRLPSLTEYVALGDSWTADVVLVNRDGVPDTTHVPVDCAQSHHNYPKIVAEALGADRFRDASCGSATTRDFRRPQTGLPLGGTNPPQFDRLTRRTELVTIGIGGNDAGIASAGLDCLGVLPVDNPVTDSGAGLPFGGCKAKYTAGGTDRLAEQIRASEIKLVRAFRAVHRLAPRARVLVLDYMDVIPDHGCYPTVPASDEDMAYIAAKFRQLNRMVERAARRGGAEFVDTFSHTGGHDLCQDPVTRWAETYGPSVNDPAVGVPAHPNAAGARAQAAVLLQYLRDTECYSCS